MDSTELRVRNEYEGKMESKLKEVGAKIDELMVKGEAAKEHLSVKIEELKRKHAKVNEELLAAKTASKEAWHELKPGLDKAWEDLVSAFGEIKQATEKAATKLHK